MITSIKLFYSEAAPMVAVYGVASDQNDGWRCNLPAHEVFSDDPKVLPVEQQVSLADARHLLTFIPSFLARFPGAKLTLAMPQLVSEISATTGLAEPDVQRIVANTLQQFRALVANGGQFTSAALRIQPRPAAANTPGQAPAALVLPVPAAGKPAIA